MWKKGLILLASNPDLIGKVLEEIGSMPNIEFPTLGGHVFWENLAEYKGWKIQRNVIFKNCRILDPDDTRQAWGGETAMKNAFSALCKY
jgi:hypothetical protein